MPRNHDVVKVGDYVMMLGEPTHLAQITHISEQADNERKFYRLQSVERSKELAKHNYYARWLYEDEFRAANKEELTSLRLM
jgi:hypothetical protein